MAKVKQASSPSTAMSVMDKLRQNSTIDIADVLADSKFFHQQEQIMTPIPMFNVALSGKIDGGYGGGLTILAGASKNFKTSFALLMAKSFLDKYPDGVVLYYDSEFGTKVNYFESFGIDTSRVLHTPITDIEQMKFDVVGQLDGLSRDDHVMIVVDSIGNLASKKEIEDALDRQSKADMTRAKALKSFFRMVTPHLTLKNIPMVCVNHIYMTQEMFSRPVVSGGTGIYYSADTVFIIGRQQDKEGTDLLGYNFIINIDKSRFVKEKSKIPVTVAFEGGILKWSGLIDVALELGYVTKPKQGKYARVNRDTGEIEDQEFTLKATATKDFWAPILRNKNFRDDVEKMFSVGTTQMVADEVISNED